MVEVKLPKDQDYIIQILSYCLNVTNELTKKGVVQKYEQEIYPCADNPLTPKARKEIEKLIEELDDGNIKLQFTKGFGQ